ncbi:MAG: PIG-L family deacetylase [Chitinophagaceae bacterium]|nr:PIG-L family deacetylase [Anaerolineae bacterium]
MHVFLSPHLDDAVLSCGGTIHHLTQRGESVTILTLMAGDPPNPLPDTPIVRDLHQRWAIGESPVAARRQEDTLSAAVVGATAKHREYADSVYRTHLALPLYPSEQSIFGEINPEDSTTKYLTIESTLFRFVFLGVTTLYAPLGVGHHVDHQIVRDWSLEIRQHTPGLEIKFYEEYPYTRNHEAIQNALMLMKPRLKLKPETQPLSESDMSAKINAIACYKSQISTFWKSEDAMRRDVESAFCIGSGIYAERYWHIQN